MGNEMNELRYLDLKNTLCEKYMKVYIRMEKDSIGETVIYRLWSEPYYGEKNTGAYGKGKSDCPRSGKWNTVTLKNYGNANPLDVVALTAPSRNPFCKFYCRISKAGMGKKYTITICRGTGKSNVGRLSVPSVYEKYQKRGSMAG